MDSDDSDAEIDNWLERCVIMTDDRVLIGFVITKEDTLHLIMIAPNYQKQRYGAELLAYIEQMIFDRFSLIRLQSFANNATNHAFTKSMIGDWRKHSRRKLFPLVCMRSKNRDNMAEDFEVNR